MHSLAKNDGDGFRAPCDDRRHCDKDDRRLFRQLTEIASLNDADEKHLVSVRGDLDSDGLSRYVFSMFLRDYAFNEAFTEKVDRPNATTVDKDPFGLIAKLSAESARLSDRTRPHVLQIRSVPVPDFGYLLRHYFVRIDEIVDVHPGNEQRICLRGWYRATDVGSDRLEKQYLLCSVCLDASLKKLWHTTKGFSFIFKNCDHSCNRSKQSMFVATMLFVTCSTTASLLLDGAVAFFVCILVVLAFMFAVVWVSQTTTSVALIALLGHNPSTVGGEIAFYRCSHVQSAD